MLVVGFDATPLLGHQTGIGVYTRQLLAALAGAPDELGLVGTAFTLRGRRQLPPTLPAGVAARSRPVPARVLRALWARAEWPPVESLCGPVDVFHGTNFVLPPTQRARGVVTVHDLSFLRYPQTVHADSLRYRELVPRSLARADVVCVLSQAMGDEVGAEYGIDPARIQVTAPGVDESWFAATPLDTPGRARLGLPERYLLAVGTLEPRKNLRHLVAAYRRLRAEAPDTPPLVLAGPTGWGEQLAADGLPADALRFTGYLDDADLRGVVAGAACLAYPSLYEGFGIPPVEALACGVPVVATDLAVTREVLGSAATLVPSDDLDALSAALADALARPGSAETRAARRAQAAHWTWPRCAAAAVAAYRQARAG